MVLELRAMREDEFDGYRDYFIPDYAAEIVSNYGLSEAEALAKASKEIATQLSEGAATTGHVLLCITIAAEVVGYIWYRPNHDAKSVFINDYCILPAHQGKGYGKQALAALEAQLVKDGFSQISLRVAADNERAQHVYLQGGFQATGINMIRRIGQD